MADFSLALKQDLEEHKTALPEGFNQERFVQNAVALLNSNDTLIEFCRKYENGMAQVKAGMLRGAYLGLDFLNKEAYLIPYGNTLTYQTSYLGEVKLRQKYAIKPVKHIFAEIVREGDEFHSGEDNGTKWYKFVRDDFGSGEVKGAFAVVVYQDGTIDYEIMRVDELENTRSASKAKNSPAWSKFPLEMYRKTVIRRLCKRIDMDFSVEQRQTLDEEMAIINDPIEQRDADVEENANAEEFVDVDATIVEDNDGQGSFV